MLEAQFLGKLLISSEVFITSQAGASARMGEHQAIVVHLIFFGHSPTIAPLYDLAGPHLRQRHRFGRGVD